MWSLKFLRIERSASDTKLAPARAGVPFILVEYHRKCGDFLDEIGYRPEGRVGDASADPVEAARRVAKLAVGGRAAPPWTRSIEDSCEMARLNFTAAPYSEGRR